MKQLRNFLEKFVLESTTRYPQLEEIGGLCSKLLDLIHEIPTCLLDFSDRDDKIIFWFNKRDPGQNISIAPGLFLKHHPSVSSHEFMEAVVLAENFKTTRICLEELGENFCGLERFSTLDWNRFRHLEPNFNPRPDSLKLSDFFQVLKDTNQEKQEGMMICLERQSRNCSISLHCETDSMRHIWLPVASTIRLVSLRLAIMEYLDRNRPDPTLERKTFWKIDFSNNVCIEPHDQITAIFNFILLKCHSNGHALSWLCDDLDGFMDRLEIEPA